MTDKAMPASADGALTGGAFVTETPAVSVVIPAKDEIGNLPGLIEEIRAALDGRAFGVIAVDGGSSDGTDRMLAELAATLPWLRPVRHGDIVATINGDG